MSFAVFTANIFAAFLSVTFPGLLAALGAGGAFVLYAALNIIALVLVFLLLPETRLKTLDELDEVFSVPTRTFAAYQTKNYLPWFVKYYLFRDTKAELQPLVVDSSYWPLEQEDEEH
jgi:hypothetical protein